MPHPTYDELCVLNPLLRSKTPEEVESLQQELEQCGYEWDSVNLKYVNEQTGRGIRTMGLDLFTVPGRVTAAYRKHLQAIADDPDRERGKALATVFYRRWATRLLWILILDVLAGWLVLPIWTWLGSIAALIGILVTWAQWLHNKYYAPDLARHFGATARDGDDLP